MASENETVDSVADCIRHLADNLPNGVILNIAQCNFIAANLIKARDDLKAKLATSQNYEAVIAAKERQIAIVEEERNRLNAKVNELMKRQCASATGELGNACSVAKRCQELDAENKTLKAKLESYPLPKPRLQAKVAEMEKKLAAAERCIEDVKRDLERSLVLDDAHSPAAKSALSIIRAYREKEAAR